MVEIYLFTFTPTISKLVASSFFSLLLQFFSSVLLTCFLSFIEFKFKFKFFFLITIIYYTLFFWNTYLMNDKLVFLLFFASSFKNLIVNIWFESDRWEIYLQFKNKKKNTKIQIMKYSKSIYYFKFNHNLHIHKMTNCIFLYLINKKMMIKKRNFFY